MTQAKPQEQRDIDTTNRILGGLQPYLFFEQEITDFVAKRMFAQAEGIRNEVLRFVALATIYYSLDNPGRGSELMEEAIKLHPEDGVTWRQFSLCTFWRRGPIAAREITRRSMDCVFSSSIARDGLFYAMNSGDFDFMEEMYCRLDKSNKMDEVFSNGFERERHDMEKGMGYVEIAKSSGKTDTIKRLAALMFDKINLGQKLSAVNHLIDVSEYADETSLLYELHIPGVSPQTCASMNLKLIADRVEVGLLDWDVGAIFVSKLEEDDTNASNS